jgi:4-hydroxy-tetrahydrodipicolinate synthase
MPACQSTDVHVAIWDKWQSGDEAGARQLFNQLLPLINYERLYGVAVYKEVLYRRGIFATRTSRLPSAKLDDADRTELDAILADVGSLFTV